MSNDTSPKAVIGRLQKTLGKVKRGPRLDLKLTVKQEHFVTLLAAGGTQSDAYRKAYPISLKWKKEQVHCQAAILASNPRVIKRLEALRAPAVKAVGLTVESHLVELARLREEGITQGQVGAAVTAEVSRGKVAGFYIEKREIGTPGAFGQLDAMRKQAALDAVMAEIERRERLGLMPPVDVSDVEPKE